MTTGYYDLGGTFRSLGTFETLNRLKPLFPNFGITRVAHVTGLDNIGIAVTTCMRPGAKHLSVSQGKGQTRELAEISAIMESIEGFHIENPPPIMFTAAYQDLKKNSSYACISPSFFQKGILEKKDIEHYPLNWVKAYNLLTKKSLYIPHILVCADSTVDRPEYAFISVSSNGLAAGNTREEALCHALYEIIERDALCQWQQLTFTKRNAMKVDIRTVSQGNNAEFLLLLKNASIEVRIWHITSAIGIPAFHCAILDNNVFRGIKLFTGTGCHLSKEIALSRAITEAVQGRLTYIMGSRDDIYYDFYQNRDQEYTVMNENGYLEYTQIPQPVYAKSFISNINQIVHQIKLQGFNYFIYVDHTKPEFDIPVVQVFIPGLAFNGSRM